MFKEFIFAVIFILIILLSKKMLEDDKNMCKDLYVLGNNKVYKILNDIINRDFCKQIIVSGKKNGSIITEKWYEYKPLKTVIENVIYPEIAQMFSIDAKFLTLENMSFLEFVPGEETEFMVTDSDFTFVIQLNESFVNGGTRFFYNNENVRLNPCQALIFSGQNKHKEEKISEGVRYIIKGNIHYISKNLCNKEK